MTSEQIRTVEIAAGALARQRADVFGPALALIVVTRNGAAFVTSDIPERALRDADTFDAYVMQTASAAILDELHSLRQLAGGHAQALEQQAEKPEKGGE